MKRILQAITCSALLAQLIFFTPGAYAADCTVTKTYYTGNGTNGTNGVPYIVNSITQTGSCTWTVPAGVTTADVLVVGGGGGGAGGYAPGYDDGGGAGGAGGAFQAAAYPLTPGAVISVVVGAGGAGGASSNLPDRSSTQGGQGTSTSFGSVSGGGGGSGGATGSNLQNGLAGTAGGGGGGSSYHWNAYTSGSGGTGNSVTVSGTTYTGVSGGSGSIYVAGQLAGAAGAGGGRTNATNPPSATPGSGLDSYYSGTLTTYGRGGIGYGSSGWSAGLAAQGVGYGGNGGQYATGGTAGANGIIVIRYSGVSLNSFTLSPSATSAVYRIASTITVNVSTASKVTFYANGKPISRCSQVATSGSSPNIIATCTWRPSTHGTITLTAIAKPIGGGVNASPTTLRIPVSARPGTR